MEDNYAPSNNNGSLIYGQNDDSIEVPEAEDERTASNENLTPETLRKSDCSSNWCTLPSVSILLVSNLLMIIVVFILPVICDIKPGDNFDKDEKCWVEPFSSLIYRYVSMRTFLRICNCRDFSISNELIRWSSSLTSGDELTDYAPFNQALHRRSFPVR